MTPEISILLSIFKPNLHHLQKTIDSIKIQTHDNYELIIVKDDGEPSTLAAINSITHDFKNLVLIDNFKNIGLVASLNKGLSKAKGEYIARIDVGDWWHKDKLLFQYETAIVNNLVLIGTQVNFFSTDLKILNNHQLPCNDLEIRAYLDKGKNPFVHSSVMFKRFKDTFYNENAVHTEDFELWCRYYFFGKMLNLSSCYTNYIVDMTSITSSKRFLMYVNASSVYINFMKYKSNPAMEILDVPSFIQDPRKKMTYLERKFSYYFSLASYERFQSHTTKFIIYILFSFILKPQVLMIYLKKRAVKFYYESIK